IKYKDGDKLSDYVRKINEAVKGKLPAGTEIAFQRENKARVANANFALMPYLLKSHADVTGDDLKDAYLDFDRQDNRPQVALTFNSKGAETFDRVTGENIHRQLAIVLDGVVHSAPVLQSRIPNGHAVITLGTGD